MSNEANAAEVGLQAWKASCDSNTSLKEFLGIWGSMIGEILLDAWEILFLHPLLKMLVFPAGEIYSWSSSAHIKSH